MKPDPVRAAAVYRRAADLAEMQVLIALLFFLKVFQLSNFQHVSVPNEALVSLGRFYRSGTGVPLDHTQALKCWKQVVLMSCFLFVFDLLCSGRRYR